MMNSNKQVFVFGNIGGDFPVQKQAAKEFAYDDHYYFKGGHCNDLQVSGRFHLSTLSLSFTFVSIVILSSFLVNKLDILYLGIKTINENNRIHKQFN